MGFSRQEYWSGLPCLPPGDLPDPGIKPTSLKSPALAGEFSTTCATWEAPAYLILQCFSHREHVDVINMLCNLVTLVLCYTEKTQVQ